MCVSVCLCGCAGVRLRKPFNHVFMLALCSPLPTSQRSNFSKIIRFIPGLEYSSLHSDVPTEALVGSEYRNGILNVEWAFSDEASRSCMTSIFIGSVVTMAMGVGLGKSSCMGAKSWLLFTPVQPASSSTIWFYLQMMATFGAFQPLPHAQKWTL